MFYVHLFFRYLGLTKMDAEEMFMGGRYAIGIDFGTLSARAILVDVESGEEKGTAIFGYQDAVIDRQLPNCDIELPADFALQNPADYKDATEALLKDLCSNSDIDPQNVIAIGIDFTACTVLPVDEEMRPLCFYEKFRDNPHSWAKLWKHHGAQREADLINETAHKHKHEFIKRYGGTSSSEWLFAKLIEIYHKAPEIYSATYKFVEAGDWVVWLLTGKLTTSTCMAGFKAFWNEEEGYPPSEFFEKIDPGLKGIAGKAISDVRKVGMKAGGLTKEMASLTGMRPGTSVAVSLIDAHSATPVVGAVEGDSLTMAMGTSLCHILVSQEEVFMEGISGVVKDGVIPGYYGYEAGQAAVGDIYEWFVTHLASADCFDEAAKANINPLAVMDRRAAKLKVGESGLIALDWWNGNRSMLNNANLSGVIVGLTLSTLPEEIYRALVEATAFGTREIVESMEKQGVPIRNIYACGGLSRKSEFVMQTFADVLGREIIVTGVVQTTAYGAAMYGMVSAGSKNGGYDNMKEAMEHLVKKPHKVYTPSTNNHQVYDRLFAVYRKLSKFFGEDHKDIMLGLKRWKAANSQL